MKSLLTTAVAGLMLLGIFSATLTPNNHPKKNAPVLMGDSGPIAGCLPGDPNCKPPIPPVAGARH